MSLSAGLSTAGTGARGATMPLYRGPSSFDKYGDRACTQWSMQMGSNKGCTEGLRLRTSVALLQAVWEPYPEVEQALLQQSVLHIMIMLPSQVLSRLLRETQRENLCKVPLSGSSSLVVTKQGTLCYIKVLGTSSQIIRIRLWLQHLFVTLLYCIFSVSILQIKWTSKNQCPRPLFVLLLDLRLVTDPLLAAALGVVPRWITPDYLLDPRILLLAPRILVPRFQWFVTSVMQTNPDSKQIAMIMR